MATRPSKTQETGALDLAEGFKVLASFDVTSDDPVSTEDFAAEMGITPSEAFNALDALADVELVDAKGRGLSAEWWIDVPDVSEANALAIAREALSNSAPVVKEEPRKLTPKQQEYAERTAYNAAVSASQEPGSQHLHPMEDAVKDAPEIPEYEEHEYHVFDDGTPVLPAETPVIAENGEKVTIPVDFDDPSKGRRELDAAKGERLISEETITVKATPKPERLPEIDGLDQFIDAETGDMVYESRIVKMGLALPEPDSIPQRPEGVHPNTWDMAHTAITQSARDWWLAKAETERTDPLPCDRCGEDLRVVLCSCISV